MSPPSPHRQHLADFLTEIARLFISAGISANDLEWALKKCFVNAASERSRLRNARVNQSAIAAITGLSRPQVRDCLRGISASTLGRSVLEDTVSGWVSDPEFCGKAGIPRALPTTGDRGSFQQLAKRYGGDLTPRALLAELSRRNLVKKTPGGVQLLGDLPGLETERQQMGRVLAALSRVMKPRILDSSYPKVHVISKEVLLPDVNAKSKILLRKRLSQSASAFLQDVEVATSAALGVRERKVGKKRQKSKVSVMVISHE